MDEFKHAPPRFSTAGLPIFNAGALPVQGRRVSKADLEHHQIHRRRPKTYKTFDQRHVANLVAALPALPPDGESWHIVAKGNTPIWLAIPRLIELAAEPTRDLKISTLGFGRDFAECLIDLLDSRKIAQVGILCSHYFKSTSQGEYTLLAEALAARNQPLAVARCHAKIIAATMHSGRGYTFEGSGNLRSCRSIEQVTITQDAALTRFHQRWITDLLTNGQETDAASRPHRADDAAGSGAAAARGRRK